MAELVADYFTDPLSPACWAVQPVIRRLQFELDRLEVVPRMTVLFPEAKGEPEDRDVAAVRGSGMPVAASLWADGVPSSLPACRAVAVVRETTPDRAAAYLHRVREAAIAAGDPVDAVDPLCSLAAEVGGVDASALRRALERDTATAALRDDLDAARALADDLDAGSVEVRGEVGRLPLEPRRAALGLADGPDRAAAGDDEAPALVAPPTLRFSTANRVVVADPRIGYQRLAAVGGRAIPRQVAGLSDKYGTGRLSIHVPQDVAESLSSREFVDEVRSYVRRFERVFVAEVAAGIGRAPETCRDCLETLAAAGVVEPVDPDGDGWRMIEGGPPST